MAEEEKFKVMLLINGNKEQKQHSLNSTNFHKYCMQFVTVSKTAAKH